MRQVLILAAGIALYGCGGGGDNAVPVQPVSETDRGGSQLGLVEDDANSGIEFEVVNSTDLAWHCSGEFEGQLSVRLEAEGTAAYTSASGEAFMMTWQVNRDSREIVWDDDLDGQTDRVETIEGPILSMSSNSLFNLYLSYSEVGIVATGDGRQLNMRQVKERNSAVQYTDLVCDESPA